MFLAVTGNEVHEETKGRVCSRFEFQFDHLNQIKLHFFPTSYKNYEQCRRKLGTFLEIYFKSQSLFNGQLFQKILNGF